MPSPLAVHQHTPGQLDATASFVKRTRSELRMLRCVRLWPERLHIVDVNKDYFEIVGLGYRDPDVVTVLRMVNAAYDPQTIHEPASAEPKELGTGKCHPWAEDRVM